MKSKKIFLILVFAFAWMHQIQAQCAGFTITDVTSTNVTCNGFSDGIITVTYGGGTGPYQYSIGGTGTQLTGTEPFDNSTSLATGTSTTAKFWSPSSCTTGGLVWNASNGCTGGAVGYSGSFNNFFGCFLRSPEVSATGLNEVVVSFDVSHSYSASNPNNRMRFYVWDNNFSSGSHYYRATSVKINNVEVGVVDINGIWLYYSQLRACVHVEVTYDLATIPNSNRLLFYLEPNSGYNNSHVFYTWIDNVSVSSGTSYQASNQFTGLPAGNYNVVIQDSNGCIATYSSNPVVITQPATLSLMLTPNNPSMIGGNDGSINFSVSGGTPSYSYTSSGGTLGSGLIYDLTAGTYCITVTDLLNCTKTECATLNNPSCTGFTISSINRTDITCNGANDGALSLTATGGTPSYEYSINGGLSFQLSNTFSNLSPGTYSIVVKDGAGCTVASSSTIAQPTVLSLSFSVVDETAPGSLDGAIDLTIAGGNGGNVYLWSTNGATTQDINNLSAGTYCVTVTDSKNCTVTGCDDVVTLTSGCLGFAIDSVLKTDISCFGDDNGEIRIVHLAGTAPVVFSIDSGSTWQIGNAIFTGLTPGNYNIIIRDNLNCMVVYNKNPVVIIEPPVFVPVITPNGNLLSSTGTGNFQWYRNGNQIPNANSSSYTATQSGDYHVTATNSAGCSGTSAPVNVTTVGVEENNFPGEIIIYPNPASDFLKINIALQYEQNVRIEVLDIYGRAISSFPSRVSNDFNEKIEISNLTASLYWLKIQAGEKIYYRKFLKS